MIFKFGFDHGMLEKPVRTGQSFEKPSAKTLRKARAEGGQRMFEADELRRILDELTDETVLRAMVLLAVNCGYGQTDIASLPETAVDLDNGWAEFPRPKTGIERRAKLWPETVAALREVLDTRPVARDKADAGIVFLTPKGKRWLRVSQSENPKSWSSRSDLIGANFSRVLRRLHINGRRGLGFYTLRHVLETIGGESRDQVAVDAVMGHVDASMAGRYRERISDARLEAVAETVRLWLFGDRETAAKN
jgi:integrase